MKTPMTKVSMGIHSRSARVTALREKAVRAMDTHAMWFERSNRNADDRYAMGLYQIEGCSSYGRVPLGVCTLLCGACLDRNLLSTAWLGYAIIPPFFEGE